MALRYGEDRVWFTAAQIAAMMIDKIGFDRINMIETPTVYFNDADKWNLKRDNLCWVTKEQYDEQKDWLKRFIRQDKFQIYIKNILGYNEEHIAFRYPLKVEDMEEFRWAIIELNKDGYNIGADQEKLYVRLLIQFMIEAKAWKELIKVDEMGL